MVKQFTLYRPGSNQRDKNLSSVACTITERGGIADIQMDVLNKAIGKLTIAYDGGKIIIVMKDSEGKIIHCFVHPGK